MWLKMEYHYQQLVQSFSIETMYIQTNVMDIEDEINWLAGCNNKTYAIIIMAKNQIKMQKKWLSIQA